MFTPTLSFWSGWYTFSGSNLFFGLSLFKPVQIFQTGLKFLKILPPFTNIFKKFLIFFFNGKGKGFCSQCVALSNISLLFYRMLNQMKMILCEIDFKENTNCKSYHNILLMILVAFLKEARQLSFMWREHTGCARPRPAISK